MRKMPLLVAILGALAACRNTKDGKACIKVPAEQTACPAVSEIKSSDFFVLAACNWQLDEVEDDAKGTRETVDFQTEKQVPLCCYAATLVDDGSDCVGGRPYFDGGMELRAPLLSDGAPPALSSTRAAAWASAGASEHASVAAFARLSLQLMRLGAPTDLLRDVHRAAMDEVRHAEICWEMAQRFGASRVSAGAFPFPDRIGVDVELPALAAAAVREGCLAETLGAHVVSVAAERASEPAVRSALRGIALEEAEHAVLSFRIVAWALRVGGAALDSAVRAAFAMPWPKLDVEELALRANVDVELLRPACEQAAAEVIQPAAAALLAA